MTPEQLASAINELYDTWTFQTRKLIAALIRQRDREVYEAGQLAMRERCTEVAANALFRVQNAAEAIRALTPEEMP